ncbi:MAG TPA: SGNH/GDSL hydrolase family protein [Marmoricola sp.]
MGAAARMRALAVIATVGLMLCAGCGPDEQTEASPKPIRSYVAIGDTFTAAPYAGASVVTDHCRRAKQNYPARVADKLKIKKVRDVSCPGADVKAITKKYKKDGHRLVAQMKAVKRSTGLVTVQAGAYASDLYQNLADFCAPDSTTKCALSALAAGVPRVIAPIRQQLGAAVRKIGDRAPDAEIVIVGYPRHVGKHTSCPALSDMSKTDRKVWVQIDKRLNLAMAQAARDTGVDFVDVYGASKRHGICDKVPWVRPARTIHSRGVALGPTEAGEKAMAKLIVATVGADRRLGD